MLALVKQVQPCELLIQFGPPRPTRKFLVFKSTEDRERFFHSIQSAFTLFNFGSDRATRVRALSASQVTTNLVTVDTRRRDLRDGDMAVHLELDDKKTLAASDEGSSDNKESWDAHTLSLPSTSTLASSLSSRHSISVQHLAKSLNATIILCCNILSWLPSPNRPNTFNNPQFLISVLKLLVMIIGSVRKHSNCYLWRHEPFFEVLKRFVCPVLLTCADHTSAIFFKLGLHLFMVLWGFRSELGAQLAIALNHYQYGIVKPPQVHFLRKLAVWHVLYSTVFVSPAACIDVYYNFDYNPNLVVPKVFEHIITNATVVCLAQPVVEIIGKRSESHTAELRAQALNLLVHILSHVTEFVKDEDKNKKLQPKRRRYSRFQWYEIHNAALADYRKKESLRSVIMLLKKEFSSALRWESSVQDDEVKMEQNLDISIAELIGDFMYTYARDGVLDKTKVGDALSEYDNKTLTNPQHQALRAAYLRHFDFGYPLSLFFFFFFLA